MKAGKKIKTTNSTNLASEMPNEINDLITCSPQRKVDVFIGNKRKADTNIEEKSTPKRKVVKIKKVDAPQVTKEIKMSEKDNSMSTVINLGSSVIKPKIVEQPTQNIPSSIKIFSTHSLSSHTFQEHSLPPKNASLFNAGQISLQQGIIRQTSSLKPILPATAAMSSTSTRNNISTSPITSQTRKVTLPPAPSTPRMVLPKMPVGTGTTLSPVGAPSPILMRSGGNLVRLVPAQKPQTTNANNQQPFIMEKIRKPDGTIVQVLKPQALQSPKSLQNIQLSPQIISGNLVRIVPKHGKNISLNASKHQPISMKRPVFVKASQVVSNQKLLSPQAITSGKNISVANTTPSQSILSYNIINTPSTIGVKPIKLNVPIVANVPSGYPPKIIKVDPRKIGKTASSPIVIKKVLSTGQVMPSNTVLGSQGSPSNIHRIIRQGNQSRVVIHSTAALAPATTIQNTHRTGVEDITKTGGGIPSVSSLKPGISATLPDDFLDTGDSDCSEKSKASSVPTHAEDLDKNEETLELRLEIVKDECEPSQELENYTGKDITCTRSSSRGRGTNKGDIKDGGSKTNEIKENEIKSEDLGKKRRSPREETSSLKGNSSCSKSTIDELPNTPITDAAKGDGNLANKTRGEKRDISSETETIEPELFLPIKRSSRSESKLQNAVMEANTRSTRISSTQKSKSAQSIPTKVIPKKTSSKISLRSSNRKR